MALGEPDKRSEIRSGEVALDFVKQRHGGGAARAAMGGFAHSTRLSDSLTWLRPSDEAVDEEGFRSLTCLAATDDAAAQARS